MTARAKAPVISETAFQRTIVGMAHALGWSCMHVRRSKVRNDRWATATSIPGWPDLFMWHTGQHRTIAVELKAQDGRVTPEQAEVLAQLKAAGIETYVWKPSDADEAERVLRGQR